MFHHGIPPVEYTDPWSADLDERLATLRSGSPRIAYYYAAPDTSTFRYRVFNMIEALRIAEPEASAAWFTAADGSSAAEAVAESDLVVICRALYTRQWGRWSARARAARRRVLFDVDDFVFDTALRAPDHRDSRQRCGRAQPPGLVRPDQPSGNDAAALRRRDHDQRVPRRADPPLPRRSDIRHSQLPEPSAARALGARVRDEEARA